MIIMKIMIMMVVRLPGVQPFMQRSHYAIILPYEGPDAPAILANNFPTIVTRSNIWSPLQKDKLQKDKNPCLDLRWSKCRFFSVVLFPKRRG